jgi:hypothetical protein
MTRQATHDPRTLGVDVEHGLFLYAVIRADRGVPDMSGLDGAPVDVVVHGGLAAVVSRIELDRPPGRRADLIAYHDVVGRLAADDVLAPVRFGVALPDEEAVVETLLGPQEELLAELLTELDGRAQFNLRATYVEGAVLREIVEADPGVRDLRDRTRGLPEHVAYGDRVQLGELVARSLELRGEADAADLLEVIAPLVVAYTDRGGAGAEVVLDVALLVDDDKAGVLEERLEGLAEAVHERIQLRLVGPVAPYDFVGEL